MEGMVLCPADGVVTNDLYTVTGPECRQEAKNPKVKTLFTIVSITRMGELETNIKDEMI